LEQAQKNDKLFLEILFFKEKKTVFYLGEENGYEQMFAKEPTNGKKRKVAWTQEEQDELKELFEKFKPRFGRKTAEADDENDSFNQVEQEVSGDLVDQIMLHIQDGSRKRRDICNQLVNVGCVKTMDELKTDKYTNGNKKLGRNGIWRSEDLDDLKQCYELVKSEAAQTNNSILKENLMHRLQDILTIKRNKRVVANKMVEIGLIKDKNEVLGKKSKSSKHTSHAGVDSDSENEIVVEKHKKKKKSKKTKPQSEGNDLFDAESGESSANSDSDSDGNKSSSSSSSSESEEESDKKKKKSTHKSSNKILSDNEEEEEEEKTTAKRNSIDNQKSRDSFKSTEIREKEIKSIGETSKENSESKKRKKKTKYRIINEDSSSNNDEVIAENKDKALSEISNSDAIDSEPNKSNGKVVKITNKDLFNKLINDNQNDEDSSDDSDDEIPLSALVSKPKRQKLILSDDE